MVGLADAKTSMVSEESVLLDIQIFGKDMETVYTGEFQVVDIQEGDVIIGLPAILGVLWAFVKVLWEGRCIVNDDGDSEHLLQHLNSDLL